MPFPFAGERGCWRRPCRNEPSLPRSSTYTDGPMRAPRRVACALMGRNVEFDRIAGPAGRLSFPSHIHRSVEVAPNRSPPNTRTTPSVLVHVEPRRRRRPWQRFRKGGVVLGVIVATRPGSTCCLRRRRRWDQPRSERFTGVPSGRRGPSPRPSPNLFFADSSRPWAPHERKLPGSSPGVVVSNIMFGRAWNR